MRPADDGSYEILNGHYRVAAAKKLGWEAVPAIVLPVLSDEETLEYLSDTSPVGLLKKYNIDIYRDDYRKSVSVNHPTVLHQAEQNEKMQ